MVGLCEAFIIIIVIIISIFNVAEITGLLLGPQEYRRRVHIVFQAVILCMIQYIITIQYYVNIKMQMLEALPSH